MPTLAQANLTTAERRAVDRFVASLNSELGDNLVAVWLYGSRSRGEGGGLESDIDLMVITREPAADESAIDRLAVAAELAEREHAVNLAAQVWTSDHLDRRRRIESFFARELDRDKIVVYGEVV